MHIVDWLKSTYAHNSKELEQRLAALPPAVLEPNPPPLGPISVEDAVHYITKWSSNEDQMASVLKLQPRMWPSDFLVLLGREWTMADDVGQHVQTLQQVLGDNGPINTMMSSEERAAYDVLSKTLTVYRGCGWTNQKGMSWSLSLSVALKYANGSYWRYQYGCPFIITARIRKSRILAIKLDRGEDASSAFTLH